MTLALHIISRSVLYNRGRVFTARYALNPSIKQTRLVFKGLISAIASLAGCYPPGERATRIHWIGDFVGPSASLDYKKMRKNLASAWNQTTVLGLFNP